jgi:hypothetical protein
MGEYFDRVGHDFGVFLPNLLAALAILVLGWLLALLLAKLTQAALQRTTLDNRLAAWLSSDREGPPPKVEDLASKIVFWLVFVFALVAFFQRLGLAAVAGPLDGFLSKILGFLPNLLGAILLLVVAWLLARVLRFIVQKAAERFDLDEKVARSAEDPAGDTALAPDDPASPAPPRPPRRTLSKTLGEAVYWLVFLLFLPAILDALELHGLLAPVDGLVREILSFLPNLLAAVVILAIGWLFARILQRIVTNLLGAAGVDRFGARFGMDRASGRKPLSEVIGLVVYILVLLPVVIAALNALQVEAITAPASDMLHSFLIAVPRLFGAALVIAIAYFVGKLVAGLVSSLLAGIGFDQFLENIGLVRTGAAGRADQAVGEPTTGTLTPRRRPSDVVGWVVLVAVLLFASIEALSLLDFEMLAAIVTEFTVFAANVLLGLAIFVLGFYLARLAADAVRSSSVERSELLAQIARGAILVLATTMALRQMGMAEDVILLAFGLLLGALAIAAAVAFGIGGRDVAKRYVESWASKAEAYDGGTGGGGSGKVTAPRGGIEPPRTRPPADPGVPPERIP